MPIDVPRPEDCPERIHRMDPGDTVHGRLDQRLAKGRDFDELDGTHGDGRTVLWARIPEVLDGVDGAALAVLGDFVPMGVGQALGIRGGGNSLDNTLRLVKLVPTDWVLLDIRVHGVAKGFGHGLVHMFAEDGTLLATASQSCIMRYWRGPEPGRRARLTPGTSSSAVIRAGSVPDPGTIPARRRLPPRCRNHARTARGRDVGGTHLAAIG